MYGRVVACTVRRPPCCEGVNTRADLAAAGARLRDQIVALAPGAGVTISTPPRPGRAGLVIEPDAVIHPFTVLRGRTVVRRGQRSGRTRSSTRPRSARTLSWGRSVTSALHRARGAGQGRDLRGAQKAHIGEGARCPISATLGDAEVGEGTNVGAGTITANFPHEPGREKGRRRSAGTSGPSFTWIRGSCDDWRTALWIGGRLVHHRGRAAGSLAIGRPVR